MLGDVSEVWLKDVQLASRPRCHHLRMLHVLKTDAQLGLVILAVGQTCSEEDSQLAALQAGIDLAQSCAGGLPNTGGCWRPMS